MIVIQEHLRNVEKLLIAQGRLAQASTHNPSIGRIRETFLLEFLRPNLPRNIEVVSGEIIDSIGNRSGQVDCILIDNTFPLVHLGSKDHLLVIAEAVLATIEIKSHLNKSELIKSLKASNKIKSLIRDGKMTYKKVGVETYTPDSVPPINTYLFSYNGISLKELINHVGQFAWGQIDGQTYNVNQIIDCICVLGKGILSRDLQRVSVKKSEAHLPKTQNTEIKPVHLKKDSLTAFYQRLIDDIVPLKIEHANIDPYFSFGTME